MAEHVRLLVSGGGTGGHIYPALAIARGVLQRDPGARVLYAGTEDGMEHGLALDAGLPFAPVPSRGIVGKSAVDRLRAVGAAGRGLAAALGLMRRFRPNVVVGTGGYASGPVVLAAVLSRVPTLLHEQNVYPGATNRLMAPFVAAVAVPDARAAAYLSRRARVWVTGNPVRPEFFTLDRDQARRDLGVPRDARMVLAVMGSRGSATVNAAIARALPRLLAEPRVRVHWVTGRAHHATALELARAALGARIEAALQENLVVEPYSERVGDAVAASDLVLCRGGAITLAEVAAAGRAAIVVPSPFLAGQRQDWNARPLADAGAARIVMEEDLAGDRLADEVLGLLRRPEALGEMGRAARGVSRPRALEDLVDGVVALSQGRLPARTDDS